MKLCVAAEELNDETERDRRRKERERRAYVIFI
jgi:hypothetical protein